MIDYKVVNNLNSIKDYINGAKVIAFDFETAPTDEYRNIDKAALDPHKSDIVGISISVKKDTGAYIPLKHKSGNNMEVFSVLEFLKNEIFLNESCIKIAHNLSFEAKFLYKHSIILTCPVYDTIAAAQMTLKSDKEFRKLSDSGLKKLVPELLKIELPTFEEVTGGKHFDELDPEDIETIRYACSDSDYTLQLYYLFNDWFNKFMPKHKYIVEEIESPVAIMVGLMKFNGIRANMMKMFMKQFEAEDKLQDLKKKLDIIAGRELNIGLNASTNDFKNYLYKEQNLPILKKTPKFKEATDDEALILLKEWCEKNKPNMVEFIDTVQDFRKWSKLKSTYIDGNFNYLNMVTEAIHTDLFPLGTETGRFASRNPNCQNLPRKDNDPIGIRNFFIARDWNVFLDFDFSQIELRVGAYFCQDEKMLEAYKSNGDIHAQTTSVIYKIPIEEALDKNAENYKERRSIAKNCNFGVLYGLYPKGLQNNLKFKAGLNTTYKECEEIIGNLKTGYPKLVKWQEEVKKKARFKGYSETAFGRRRYLKGINSSEWNIKSYWERCALNTPIQGTAADILKLAMVRILNGLHDRPYIKPILTIHDELLFEVPLKKVKETLVFIKSSMEQIPFEGFVVPVIVESIAGLEFGDMGEWEESENE